jgi:large subunit ribosomal protein L25
MPEKCIILAMLTLAVKERTPQESTADLRAKGLVPAVFYGPKEESTSVSIDGLKLDRVWKEAGETTLVKLSGLGEEKDTLIHDVQFHPVTGTILHADFYVLEKGKKVTIKIPLEFVGAAPAEKLGHIVVKTLHEVEIEVAPAELPHHLDVDMSTLENVGDHITANQIKLPPSAELKTGPDEIVVSIVEFKEEKIVEAATVVPAEIIGEKTAEGAAAEGAAAGEARKEEKKA